MGAVLVPGLIAPAGGDPAATPLVQAVRLALLAFVAAPALLLLLAGGLRSARAPRHAIAWLLVPVLLVVLHLWFWATTLTFWPLGVLFVAWFVLAPVDVRLTIAALVAGVPLVAVVVATALGAPEYEYALPVAAGLACLVAASLATAFARRPPERARD